MATIGKEPYTIMACFRLGRSFKLVAGLDGRDFIFALLPLYSMPLTACEVVNPKAGRNSVAFRVSYRRVKTANHKVPTQLRETKLEAFWIRTTSVSECFINSLAI